VEPNKKNAVRGTARSKDGGVRWVLLGVGKGDSTKANIVRVKGPPQRQPNKIWSSPAGRDDLKSSQKKAKKKGTSKTVDGGGGTERDEYTLFL